MKSGYVVDRSMAKRNLEQLRKWLTKLAGYYCKVGILLLGHQPSQAQKIVYRTELFALHVLPFPGGKDSI